MSKEEEIIDFFISLGSEKELKLFESKDRKNSLTLKQQIKEKYKGFKLVYIPEKEIKEFLIEEVDKYRKILDKSTRFLVRESIINRLNQTLFVDYHTAGELKIFLENLTSGKREVSKFNRYLIDETLKRFDEEMKEKLSLTINEVKYSLEEILIARGRNKKYAMKNTNILFQYFDKGHDRSELLLKDVRNHADLNKLLVIAERNFFSDDSEFYRDIVTDLSHLNLSYNSSMAGVVLDLLAWFTGSYTFRRIATPVVCILLIVIFALALFFGSKNN